MKLIKALFCLAFVVCLSISAFAQNSKPLAQNFSMEMMDGKNVELNDLKGKVVLITFWSTKCAICAAEIPKLNQIANSYQGKDVVFLGLTTDNQTNVERYLKSKPFSFDIVPNSFGTLMKYADRDAAGNIIMGYPAYFLVNQSGEIEMKANGWDKTQKIDSQITRLLLNGKAKSEKRIIYSKI